MLVRRAAMERRTDCRLGAGGARSRLIGTGSRGKGLCISQVAMAVRTRDHILTTRTAPLGPCTADLALHHTLTARIASRHGVTGKQQKRCREPCGRLEPTYRHGRRKVCQRKLYKHRAGGKPICRKEPCGMSNGQRTTAPTHTADNRFNSHSGQPLQLTQRTTASPHTADDRSNPHSGQPLQRPVCSRQPLQFTQRTTASTLSLQRSTAPTHTADNRFNTAI